jgi:hypothetical protein
MPSEPKIIAEGAEQRAAAEFTQTTRLNLPVIIGTREDIAAKIKATVPMPLELQELLLKLNSLTDAGSTHWRLAAHIFPHNGGFDVGATISRIS